MLARVDEAPPFFSTSVVGGASSFLSLFCMKQEAAYGSQGTSGVHPWVSCVGWVLQRVCTPNVARLAQVETRRPGCSGVAMRCFNRPYREGATFEKAIARASAFEVQQLLFTSTPCLSLKSRVSMGHQSLTPPPPCHPRAKHIVQPRRGKVETGRTGRIAF